MQEKLYFVILAPLCSETSTFAGPGAQVGATWAPKSRLKGVRTAKVTSDRATKGDRSAKVHAVRQTCLSEPRNRPETSPERDRGGGQSLSKRQDI